MLKTVSKILILVFAVLAMGAMPAHANFFGDCGWSFWKPDCWNNFQKKKLDLKIDFAGYYNKPVDGNPNAGFWKPKDLTCQDFFNFDDIKPGDYGEGTISLHLKNQDAWGCAIIRPTKNDDNGSAEPELLEDEKDKNSDKWDGELAQNLNLKIWADICQENPAVPGDNIFQPDCDQLLFDENFPLSSARLPLSDSENANVFTGIAEPLGKDRDYYVGAEWNVPSGAGNIIQTDTYKADITFFAQQAEGNAGFRCADINDKNPEKCLNGAVRNCYTGLPATKNIGICASGTEICSKGEWGKCKNEILPEKEICADGLDNDCDGKTDEAGCKPPPCRKDAECDDGNGKTDDSCVKGECTHKEKKNFWNFCWLRKC